MRIYELSIFTGFVVVAVLAQNNVESNDPNNKFLSLPPVNSDTIASGLIGAGLATGGLVVGNQLLNNGLGNGCGRRKRQASDNPNSKFFNLGGNNCNNPCGRRKRQAGEDPNNKFLNLGGLLGGGNNGCGGYNNGGYNNGGYNNGGYNNGGYNNGGYNNGGHNNGGYNSCNCRCSGQTFYQNGQLQGECRARDNTGRTWCYVTSSSTCRDIQWGKRGKWSYNACSGGC